MASSEVIAQLQDTDGYAKPLRRIACLNRSEASLSEISEAATYLDSARNEHVLFGSVEGSLANAPSGNIHSSRSAGPILP